MKFNERLPHMPRAGLTPADYLGGPDVADREQAYQFGVRGDREGFERWANAAYQGKFFGVFDAEYAKGQNEMRTTKE